MFETFMGILLLGIMGLSLAFIVFLTGLLLYKAINEAYNTFKMFGGSSDE